MANAPRDENRIPVLLGTLNTDGSTLVAIKVSATTHSLSVKDGITGTDFGPTNAPRDENRVAALLAVSSADGTTPVAVYTDSNGMLLVQST